MADQSPKDTLHCEWQMPVGVDGVDDCPENLLSRTLRRVLQDGKPICHLSLVFLRLRENRLEEPSYRWLGTFIHSKGDRILFFPAFTGQGSSAFKDGVKQKTNCFVVDHVSLERNRAKWHFTSEGSKCHQGGPRTVDLGQGRLLWFGFSIRESNILPPVMRKTIIQVECPSSDSLRRVENLRCAAYGKPFPIIDLPEQTSTLSSPLFLHFAVITGPKGFETYTGEKAAMPLGEHWVANTPSDLPKSLPNRIHRLTLGEWDLQVVSMFLPGSINTPAAFSSPKP